MMVVERRSFSILNREMREKKTKKTNREREITKKVFLSLPELLLLLSAVFVCDERGKEKREGRSGGLALAAAAAALLAPS
jgi:hypothetical protein